MYVIVFFQNLEENGRLNSPSGGWGAIKKARTRWGSCSGNKLLNSVKNFTIKCKCMKKNYIIKFAFDCEIFNRVKQFVA